MRVKRWLGVVVLGMASGAWAQPTPGQTGVRELFYAGTAPKESLPPIRKAPALRPGAGKRDPGANLAPAGGVRPQQREEPLVIPASDTGARNLGLRYNLVLVGQQTGRSSTVSASRNFVKGECFAIDIEANRSGYLYVLARQSGGDWMPLFPSPRMTGESNVINPGQKVRVPARYCFEIADPPGEEKLFVALVRDPREVSDLHNGIGGTAVESAPQSKSGAPVHSAAYMVNNAVARMSAVSVTRDIMIREVAAPVESREVPNSVYVVNTSAKPVSKVVTEISVRHR